MGGKMTPVSYCMQNLILDCMLSHFSHAGKFMTWIVACQFLCQWDSPDKNTGLSSYTLLQGIFLIQRWNPHLLSLLNLQVDSLPLAPFRIIVNKIMKEEKLSNYKLIQNNILILWRGESTY